MADRHISTTSAMRHLKEAGAAFSLHPYAYEEKGGTATASAALNVAEHAVIKTLVMEDDTAAPLIVLMHGDRQVSTRALARQIGARSVQPCTPQKANKYTGYVVGGISPFGVRHAMRVFMEASIADLPALYINAGKRGLLMSVSPADLIRVLQPVLVTVAIV